MMDRLTKHFGRHIEIIGCKSLYPSEERKGAPLSSAIARLAAYEDTGLDPKEVNAVKLALMGKSIAEIKEFDGVPIERLRDLANAEKENAPLTLQELREMDGEPVYISFYDDSGEYAILNVYGTELNDIYLTHKNGVITPARFVYDCCGQLYRHKP